MGQRRKLSDATLAWEARVTSWLCSLEQAHRDGRLSHYHVTAALAGNLLPLDSPSELFTIQQSSLLGCVFINTPRS